MYWSVAKCIFIAKPEYISPWNLCIKAKPQFVAYDCFMEDIELGSHLSIKAKYFWPEGDRFRQVPLYAGKIVGCTYMFDEYPKLNHCLVSINYIRRYT